MKKIRILQVFFGTEIKAYEIPAFRAAVIEKAGKEHILFHNHKGEDFRHKYPLIQYKRIAGKPAIMCIEKGVDEIHHFFENKDWAIKISGEIKELKLKKLLVNQFTMQVWDKKFTYSLINWLALNTENFQKYNILEGLADKIRFLENILTANLLSFAKGIDWTIEKDISVCIKDITATMSLPFKKQKFKAFNIEFITNMFIPNFTGLGKGVSKGFGTVKQI